MLILGRFEVMEIIRYNKTCFNIVSIVDDIFKEDIVKGFKNFQQNFKSIHYSSFDDIDYNAPDSNPPQEKHIRDILTYAKDKENIIVHCHAGVSRSPAVAYLIEYMRTGNADKATAVLNFNKHDPNVRIIKLGERIFNNPELLLTIQEAYRTHKEHLSKLKLKKYHILVK